MSVDVALTPCAVDPAQADGRTVVVIDVLRAGSTAATALANGALRVLPVRSLRAARTLAAQLSERWEVLLCGERQALKPPGFHLGNSPLEFVPERVGGKIIVLTTTNATRVTSRLLRYGITVSLAGLVNAPAVAKWLLQTGRDALLVCAGTNARFSFEDAFAAGVILTFAGRETELILTDSASACLALADRFRNEPDEVMRRSAHASYLQSIGFRADIDYCTRIGSVPVVPVWDNSEPGGFVAVSIESAQNAAATRGSDGKRDELRA